MAFGVGIWNSTAGKKMGSRSRPLDFKDFSCRMGLRAQLNITENCLDRHLAMGDLQPYLGA